jgi:hypothetical protein
VLYAEEYNPSGRPYVRVQYYGNAGLSGLQALIANPAVAPSNAITLAGTQLGQGRRNPRIRANAGGNGKIGDREVFKVGSHVYEVVEAQVHPPSTNDYGSWRLFLIDKTAGAVQQLSPQLTGGAQSLGNPPSLSSHCQMVLLPWCLPALPSGSTTARHCRADIFSSILSLNSKHVTAKLGYAFASAVGWGR